MPKNKSGATAMAHARAWADVMYPGSLRIEAQKRVVWLLGNGGQRFPRSMAEDIWNVFDLLVFPTDDLIECLQITTGLADGDIRGTVPKRKRKVRDWVLGELRTDGPPAWLGPVRIMAWIPRKHFRVWTWDWALMDWVEGAPVAAPLPRKVKAVPESDDHSAPVDDRRCTET